MRGTIWSVVALGSGVVMLPLVLPDSGFDTVGDNIFGVLTSLTPLLGVVFAVAVFGLLLVMLGFDNGF